MKDSTSGAQKGRPHLVVLGYSEAGMFLRGRGSEALAGIVSIHGAREFGVEGEARRRIDLSFDDVEVAEVGDRVAELRVAARRRWAAEHGLVEVGPTVTDAERIVGFARAVQGEEGVVLCQCGAGMSRAAAAGLICLAVWRGAGAEEACVAEVLRVRPGAVPHVGLVRLADGVLGRGGRLVGAVIAARV